MPDLVTDVIAVLGFLLASATTYRQFLHRRRRLIVALLGFRMGARFFNDLAFSAELVLSNQGDLPATLVEIKLCVRYPNAEGDLPLHWSRLATGEATQPITLAPGELRHLDVVFELTALHLANLLGECVQRNAAAILTFSVVDDRGVKRTRAITGITITLETSGITGTSSPAHVQLRLVP